PLTKRVEDRAERFTGFKPEDGPYEKQRRKCVAHFVRIDAGVGSGVRRSKRAAAITITNSEEVGRKEGRAETGNHFCSNWRRRGQLHDHIQYRGRCSRPQSPWRHQQVQERSELQRRLSAFRFQLSGAKEGRQGRSL